MKRRSTSCRPERLWRMGVGDFQMPFIQYRFIKDFRPPPHRRRLAARRLLHYACRPAVGYRYCRRRRRPLTPCKSWANRITAERPQRATKMPMTSCDIPGRLYVSQQRREDQRCRNLGEVMTNTLGNCGSQATRFASVIIAG